MTKKYYTLEELQALHLYEMPNMVYNKIMDALTEHFGKLTTRLVEIFDNAIVSQLDQFIDLYSIVGVIS